VNSYPIPNEPTFSRPPQVKRVVQVSRAGRPAHQRVRMVSNRHRPQRRDFLNTLDPFRVQSKADILVMTNSPMPGWYPDPSAPGIERFWDGNAWTSEIRTAVPSTPNSPNNSLAIAVPARTAHGIWYWLLFGWLWGVTKWFGRVMLWIFIWPVGLWRSIRHSNNRQATKMIRGLNNSQRR
jgi:hypothetical protein